MRGKNLTAGALAISILLLLTGCGAGARLVKALGETEDNSVSQESDAASAENTKEEHIKSRDKETPGTETAGGESVTTLDDIFSGGKESSGKENDEEDLLVFKDDEAVLSYNEFVVENLDKCKQDLAKDKGSVQREVESDTVQWMNATYALITENNDGDRTLVGGMERDIYNAMFMRYQLYTGWGIEDAQSADETLEWLTREGHQQEYEELVELFEEVGLFEMSKGAVDEVITEGFGEYGDKAVNRFKALYDCHMEYGEKGILAWDLCRVNQVAAWCYVAGYYTLDEALEIQYQNSRQIQESFSSWDDMVESYLYGVRYWKGEPADSAFSDTSKRRNIYDSLKEIPNGPYSYDFNTELQRSWQELEEERL